MPGVVFPFGLGGIYPQDEYSILDFLEIPVDLPPWANANACQTCERSFSFFKRRHHCRNCGGSFCGDHSRNRTRAMYGGRSLKDAEEERRGARVCDHCYCLVNEGQEGQHSRMDFPLFVLGLEGNR